MGRQGIWTGWAGGAALAGMALACAGLEAQVPADRAPRAPAAQGGGGAADGLVQEIEPGQVMRRPPKFITVAPATAREGELYRYGFAALDPDGEALSFTLVRAPEGAELEGRLLKWVPGKGQTGRRERFVLRAVDEHGAARVQAWTVIPAREAPTALHHLRRHRGPAPQP
jgi:hypothetical protein